MALWWGLMGAESAKLGGGIVYCLLLLLYDCLAHKTTVRWSASFLDLEYWYF